MKKAIFASALASLMIAGSAFAAGYTFTNYLSVGTTGADVTALQTWLVSNGFLTMPSGVAMGYFGQLTKAAVVKYQASVGLPATGFVGPLTVAKLNSSAAMTTTTTTVACPAGYTCTALPGSTTTTTTTTTAPAGITTPGVEGTLSVDQGAVSNTTIYEGQTQVPVLNLRLRASQSDIDVQRVQVNLGSNAQVYTKQFSKIYVIGDNGQVLAWSDLNANTVTKTGGNYFITLNGFHYIVAKNTYRYITVNADVYGSVNTTYQGAVTFTLPTDGVRGVDGAGLDETSGGNDINQSLTLSPSLVDSADLKISTNSATPLSQVIVANGGANNDQADKVTVLVFDVKAEKDAIGITDLVATTTVNGIGQNGTTTSAYLYDGSNLIASAAVASNGTISFNNIAGVQGYVIPQDTTKTFTLKLDLRTITATPAQASTTIAASGIAAVNSQGTNLSSNLVTGSAISNTLTFQKAGPVFTLTSKGTTKTTTVNTNAATSTSVLDAAFNIHIAAVGKSVTFGTAASTTNALAKAASTYANSSFGLYLNGADNSTTTVSAPMVVDFATPDTGVTLDSANNSFTIADGQSADVTVHAKITVTGAASSNGYAVQVKKLYWDGTSSTFMANLNSWRTDSVVLP